MLIEFCQTLDLHIVNGRFGKDLGTGKKTCNDSSTIDYGTMLMYFG